MGNSKISACLSDHSTVLLHPV